MLRQFLTQNAGKHLCALICLITLLLSANQLQAISSLSRNDPYPIFTSLDPQWLLYQQQKQKMLDLPYYDINERVSISISPFGQNADSCVDRCKNTVPLGDLDGRWSMIGLLMGCLPQGKTYPPALLNARLKLFPNIDPATPILATCVDPDNSFGYFSVPVEYRKRGIRFEMQARIGTDVGIRMQTGVADICQTVSACLFIDKTGDTAPPCMSDFPDVTKSNVQKYLMCKLCPITKELGLDIDGFHQTALEDLRVALYWRRAFLINEGRKNWEEFLVVPFLMIEGSIPLADKQKQPWKVFGLSFGSNDCNAIGFTSGLDVDFRETIDIGIEAGIAHFFSRDIPCFYMPTSCCQSGIFPFSTDVTLKPGINWHFGAKMNAYHFLGNLSFYFQYLFVNHNDDCLKMLTPDSAFKPGLLEERSSWQSQFGNVGFTYDISPNISIGFFWQAPFAECNAYKSSTVMGCFNAVY